MNKIEQLIRKGVNVPNPHSVEIGDDVDVSRIATNGITIYSGCKIYGQHTFIAEGARIGFEGPVTIEDCYIGPGAALKGGFFRNSVLLQKAACGSGAHVRQGTILEEQVTIGHTVGLKQTILFPFVTLGSLINFCDCLMSGGTSRKNHSEVGSSYIHFNFTPNQDKATPSLMGDVPKGVMLNQPPIFLGGQGGLVGPCRLTFGTVLAAGSICRKDQLQKNQLIFETNNHCGSMPFKRGQYHNLKRLVINNFHYLANLLTLRQWYLHVRYRFRGLDFPEPLFEGLKNTLQIGIEERLRQMRHLSHKSGDVWRQTLATGWLEIEDHLQCLMNYNGEAKKQDHFLALVDQQIKNHGKDYIKVVQGFDKDQSAVGTAWLQGIADHILAKLIQYFPQAK